MNITIGCESTPSDNGIVHQHVAISIGNHPPVREFAKNGNINQFPCFVHSRGGSIAVMGNHGGIDGNEIP
jgi:hypothetical protein